MECYRPVPPTEQTVVWLLDEGLCSVCLIRLWKEDEKSLKSAYFYSHHSLYVKCLKLKLEKGSYSLICP